MPILWHQLLRKEEDLLWNWMARRQEASLKSVSSISSLRQVLGLWGNRLIMWKCCQGRFWWATFGTWAFMVKVVRGFSIRSSRTADPSLLKGFWCSSSGHVHPGPWVLWWQVHETLVPGVTGGQISFLCACFGCVTCGFGLLSLQSNSSC